MLYDIHLGTYILLAIIVFVIVFNIVCLLVHFPWKKLNSSQMQNMIDFGLLHFTNSESADEIMKSHTVKYDREGAPLFLVEKNFIWFYPCYESLEDSINMASTKVKSVRNPEVCLRLTGFEQSEADNFLFRDKDDVIVYIGDLTKKNIVKYMKKNNKWVESDS